MEVINMRTPPVQRSVEEQLASLTPAERSCVDELRAFWAGESRVVEYSDAQLLRFARCSPGPTKFNAKTAKKVMMSYGKWGQHVKLHHLNVHMVRHQLEKLCLVIPGTRDVDGNLMLYMRPSLFYPRKDSLDELLRSLVYLLECLTEDEHAQTEGICFIANMASWGWSNFGVNYCRNFMDTMQGRFPLRVRRFLIANPPRWFGAIWKIMRPMLSAEFAAKISMPRGEKVVKFFKSKDHMPTEMGGRVDLGKQMSDFIAYRYEVEGLDSTLPYGPLKNAVPVSARAASGVFDGKDVLAQGVGGGGDSQQDVGVHPDLAMDGDVDVGDIAAVVTDDIVGEAEALKEVTGALHGQVEAVKEEMEALKEETESLKLDGPSGDIATSAAAAAAAVAAAVAATEDDKEDAAAEEDTEKATSD